MTREERTKIYNETVNIVKNGSYVMPNANGASYVFEYTDKMVEGTVFYDKKVNIDHDSLERYDTEIKVVNNDCLYEARAMLAKQLKPAVLNMASFRTPGGGVIRGSAAQEESIFRRTDIYKSLYQFHTIGLEYDVPQRYKTYPLNFNFGGIYSPLVTVFRASEGNNCNLLGVPYIVDVISVPAVKKPRIEGGRIVPWVRNVIKDKICQIFDIALEHGNDALVLSAFGCGAYGTPPAEMAELFKEVIDSKDYKGVFKAITFAIIDVPSTNGTHNPEGNLKPFIDVFGG